MGILRALGASILAASLSAHAVEPGEIGVKQVMALGKFVGLCGSFAQMAKFQESTELDGGHEFVARFLLAESSRLGLTPQEFMDQCSERIKVYDAWYELDFGAPEGAPSS